MTRHHRFLIGCIGVGLSAALLAGCTSSTPPVRFYTLAALPQAPDSTPASAPAAPAFTVAVRPVMLPDILERPQIVIRTGENTVSVSEFQRWAGTLRKDFARVLMENLELQLKDERAAVAPDDAALNPDFLVTVSVNRFDGRPAGAVQLSAVWSVKHLQRANLSATRTSSIREPVAGDGYEGLVSALSGSVAELSREIAAQIIRLRATP
jgi:uncharacterized lipoprotein YmbA